MKYQAERRETPYEAAIRAASLLEELIWDEIGIWKSRLYVRKWNDEVWDSRLTGSIQIPGIQLDGVTFTRKACLLPSWCSACLNNDEGSSAVRWSLATVSV